jgi:hypothetical protein
MFLSPWHGFGDSLSKIIKTSSLQVNICLRQAKRERLVENVAHFG